MAEDYNPDQKLTGIDLRVGSSGTKLIDAIYRMLDESQNPPVEVSMLVYVDGTYDIFAAGTGDVIDSGNYEDIRPEDDENEGYAENDEDTGPDDDEETQDSGSSE